MATLPRTLSGGILALTLTLAAARADVQRYRYEIDTRSGDESYAGDLPAGGAPAGPWHEVERDAKGRIVRVADFRDGNKLSEVAYHFAGDSMGYDGSDEFKSGEHTGKSSYARNEKGDITGIGRFTVGGSPTLSETRTYGADGVDNVVFAADGTVRDHYVLSFTAEGALSGYRRIVGNSYYDYVMDAATGLQKSRRKVEDGKQVLSTTFAYDENGDKLREDIFDSNGKPYATITYSAGLMARKSYRFDDGSTRVTDITYDAKREATVARLSVNGALICTFTYDRLPDGTVKRTLALGPNGDLWAEYPDRMVNEVGQDGQPVNRTDGIIHHKGNWW